MGTRRGGPRPDRSRPSGQHFLRSSRLAAELVDLAAVGHRDVVLEIGAGAGRLTGVLARRAHRVIAVEIDPELAERLRRLFAEIPHVEIVEADILQLALPSVPFRVFGNVPFALTSAILRRLLDDPSSTVWRADLLVQYEVARKRASMWPSTLASLRWLPWWKFCLVRHLSRRSFEPPPPVDAGMLSITRRTPPLVPPEQRARFARLLGVAFRRTPQPVGRSLTDVVSPNTWKRFARERGLNPAATATDLDVFDWVDLYRLVQSQPGRKM